MALADYEDVASRLPKFWTDHPDGRVVTDLIAYSDTSYIVQARLFRKDETEPAATGYAHEFVSDKGVNSTSALENCETSAIGRALANLNYAAKGKRPSRQEMAKVERGRPEPPAESDPAVLSSLRDDLTGALSLDTLAHVAGRIASAVKDGKVADPDAEALRQLYREAVALLQEPVAS